jgi:hypothetical protein
MVVRLPPPRRRRTHIRMKAPMTTVRTTRTNTNVRRSFTTYSHSDDGFIGSFNGKLRDELLNTEIFDTYVDVFMRAALMAQRVPVSGPSGAPT